MKTSFLFTCILLVAFNLQSSAQSFEKGSNVVNVGIGFGSALRGFGTQTPAISASYEHGIWEVGEDFGVISLGGYLGIKSYRNRYGSNTDRLNYTIIGVRGAFHYVGFTDLPKLDVYAGAMISYNHLRYTSDASGWTPLGAYGSAAGATAFLGARWYFTDNIAAYSELGYGVAYFNLGVSFKF